MQILATLIATAEKVEAARAAQPDAAFTCRLSATGELPATHYASSGYVEQDSLPALSGLCAITTGQHVPRQVIAAAGLIIITEALSA